MTIEKETSLDSADKTRFTKEEADVIRRINALATVVYENRQRIGKMIDDYIEKKGGVSYGDATLKRLANHPHLQCSEEQLRRCWQYYRLWAAYKKTLGKYQLPYSHLYQLSRMLTISDENVREEAIHLMAAKAHDEKLTASKLEKQVSTHLKSLHRTNQGAGSSDQPEEGVPIAPPETVSDSFATASETILMLAQAVIKEDAMPFAKVRAATNRLGFTYVELVKRLAAGDGDVRTDVDKIIAELTKAIKACEETKGAHV
jgi:hypothetical protein